MTEFAGTPSGTGRRFCLVSSRYNRVVTERLVEGAREALENHGAAPEDIDVVRVPGAWELPAAAQRAAESGYDALIAIGCVVRGETPHFDYICQGVTSGLSALALEIDAPLTFGVITADTLEQARERAGGKHGNKGAEAAVAALELLGVFAQLDAGAE